MADTPDRFSPEDPTDLPKDWVNFLSEDKLWKWKPIHPSIRIATQQSVFVFGPGEIDKKDYESIEIDGGSKGKIREELAGDLTSSNSICSEISPALLPRTRMIALTASPPPPITSLWAWQLSSRKLMRKQKISTAGRWSSISNTPKHARI